MTARRLTPWLATLRRALVALAASGGLLLLPACVVDATDGSVQDDEAFSEGSSDLEAGDPIDIGTEPGADEDPGDDSGGPEPIPWRTRTDDEEGPNPPHGVSVAASGSGTAKDEP